MVNITDEMLEEVRRVSDANERRENRRQAMSNDAAERLHVFVEAHAEKNGMHDREEWHKDIDRALAAERRATLDEVEKNLNRLYGFQAKVRPEDAIMVMKELIEELRDATK